MAMAESTTASTPIFTSEVRKARELMTVASMPMWSPVTRSPPLDATATPRKMFPPPMTTPTSTPSVRASAMSAAIRSTTETSMPKCCLPIRASPDALSRTRRYSGFIRSSNQGYRQIGGEPPPVVPPIHEGRHDVTRRPATSNRAKRLLFDSRGNFRREIRLFLLNALAQRKADVGGDFRRRANFLLGRLQSCFHGQVRIDHESLLEKHHLLIELAQPALDHLLDDVFRLAGGARLLRENCLLALDCGRVELFDAERQRVGGCDVHGYLPAEGSSLGRVARRLDSHQHAELAEIVGHRIVDISGDSALLDRQLLRSAECHVLANRSDRVLDRVRNRLIRARIFRVGHRLGIVMGQRNLRDIGDNLLERIVARNEVRFGIHFHDGGLTQARLDAYQALGGRPARLLVGLGNALLAQPVN